MKLAPGWADDMLEYWSRDEGWASLQAVEHREISTDSLGTASCGFLQAGQKLVEFGLVQGLGAPGVNNARVSETVS
jgi:hypothetical protein